MMSLAKRAGGAYLSFGLLLTGFVYGDEIASPAPLASVGRASPGLSRALTATARAASAFTHRSYGAGGGGAASTAEPQAHATARLGAM